MTSRDDRVKEESTVYRCLSLLRDRVVSIVEASYLVRTVRDLRKRLRGSWEASGVRGAISELRRWVEASFLYRWLTREPEPEVIVIDLRETWTVGPLIRLLERGADAAAGPWNSSSARSFSCSTAEFMEKHPVRAAGAVALSAIATDTAANLVVGSFDGLLLRTYLALLSLAAIVIDPGRDAVSSSRILRILRAALEPPEPGRED